MDKIKFAVQEWWFYHVTRKTDNFIPWVARKLPRDVKYWVVIDGMVQVERDKSPEDVLAMRLLDLWEPR